MVNISELDKDQLAEHAKTNFNIELDLRKNISKLVDEVTKLQAKPVVADAIVTKRASHILNRDTGMHFPWTELLHQHLKNAVPCDEEGTPV